MPVTAAFRDYVTDLLAPFGAVTFKLMFGGAGIYFKGQMFGLIVGERIYFKVRDETRPAFEAEGAKPFVFETKAGEIVATSYVELPPRLLDETEELAKWARRSYEAAIAARGRKKKPVRKNAPPRDLPLVSPGKGKKSAGKRKNAR